MMMSAGCAFIKKMGRGHTLQRYKGLGDEPGTALGNDDESGEAYLGRVTIENAAEAEHLVRVLMGEKADLRREYTLIQTLTEKTTLWN